MDHLALLSPLFGVLWATLYKHLKHVNCVPHYHWYHTATPFSCLCTPTYRLFDRAAFRPPAVPKPLYLLSCLRCILTIPSKNPSPQKPIITFLLFRRYPFLPLPVPYPSRNADVLPDKTPSHPDCSPCREESGDSPTIYPITSSCEFCFWLCKMSFSRTRYYMWSGHWGGILLTPFAVATCLSPTASSTPTLCLLLPARTFSVCNMPRLATPASNLASSSPTNLCTFLGRYPSTAVSPLSAFRLLCQSRCPFCLACLSSLWFSIYIHSKNPSLPYPIITFLLFLQCPI